jgi:hypothetical protein
MSLTVGCGPPAGGISPRLIRRKSLDVMGEPAATNNEGGTVLTDQLLVSFDSSST